MRKITIALVALLLMLLYQTSPQHAQAKDFDRPLRAKELQRLRDLTAQSMRAGAVGLSPGIEKTDAMVALEKGHKQGKSYVDGGIKNE